MKSVPLTTKILVVILVIVSVRFVSILSSRFSSSNKIEVVSQQKITAPQVQEILTCQQYTQQIKACTSQAMVCLQGIAESKKFHEDNEQKILTCQSENEKNLQLNKQLRFKLDAVTERLEQLINRKKADKQQTQSPQL